MPAIIRSSAQWDDERESSKKDKKKKKKVKKKGKQIQGGLNLMRDESIGVHDLWCGPGIGSDAADSVDCVVSATARPLSGRGKIDVDKLHHREVFYILLKFLSYVSFSLFAFWFCKS